VLADPVGSIAAHAQRTISGAGTWAVRTRRGFIPAIAISRRSRRVFHCGRRGFGTRAAARREGIAGSSSTGTLLAAAFAIAAQTAPSASAARLRRGTRYLESTTTTG
jgi:cysteine synthase